MYSVENYYLKLTASLLKKIFNFVFPKGFLYIHRLLVPIIVEIKHVMHVKMICNRQVINKIVSDWQVQHIGYLEKNTNNMQTMKTRVVIIEIISEATFEKNSDRS